MIIVRILCDAFDGFIISWLLINLATLHANVTCIQKLGSLSSGSLKPCIPLSNKTNLGVN